MGVAGYKKGVLSLETYQLIETMLAFLLTWLYVLIERFFLNFRPVEKFSEVGEERSINDAFTKLEKEVEKKLKKPWHPKQSLLFYDSEDEMPCSVHNFLICDEEEE